MRCDGSLDMQAIHLRFFDRFLRGEENGFDDEPRVQLHDPGDRRSSTTSTCCRSSREAAPIPPGEPRAT